jgi:hypothetical protein
MKLLPVPLDVAVQTTQSTTLLHILYKTKGWDGGAGGWGGGGSWNAKRAVGRYHIASCIPHQHMCGLNGSLVKRGIFHQKMNSTHIVTLAKARHLTGISRP